MARKKSRAEEDATAIDMDALRRAFRKVGADAELAKAILDLALSESHGMEQAFDMTVRRTSHAIAAREAKQREMDVADAKRVLDHDYRDDVSLVAGGIRDEINAGEITTQDHLERRLGEDIASSRRVMITFESQLGLAMTHNDGAYEERGGEAPNWEALMYAAMEQDVLEELERLGVDVNDPQPTDEEEDD